MEGIKTRKLISLSKQRYCNEKKEWYIDFAYYDENNEFTGEYEDGYITENELYELLKPKLTHNKRETVKQMMRRGAW